jgi:hypothetical protein
MNLVHQPLTPHLKKRASLRRALLSLKHGHRERALEVRRGFGLEVAWTASQLAAGRAYWRRFH